MFVFMTMSAISVYRQLLFVMTRSGDVMVRVLASGAVDRGFEPRSSQTKDYKKKYFLATPLSMQH
jgi:hypothetical protein